MEYKVSDLLKILVRKWYVILLAMCLVGGMAVWASRESYQKALEDYQRYTEEMTPIAVDTGVLEAECQYGIGSVGSSFLQAYTDQILGDELGEPAKPLTSVALLAAEPQLMGLLSSEQVIQQVQNYADSLEYQEPILVDQEGNARSTAKPLAVKDHIAVEYTGRLTFCVTISGLEETAAQELLDVYCQSLTEAASGAILDIIVEETSREFVLSQEQPTSAAILAQTIMREPVAAPNMIRTAGTAAAVAFVFACFGILLVTFIKEGKAQNAVKEGKHGHES